MNLGKVGFIFGGGGFSGAYTVGFLKALAAKGVKPDFIQGVSVGALTGAKLAEVCKADAEYNIDALEKKWLTIQELGPSAIFNKKEIFRNLRKTALFSNQRAYQLLIKDFDLQAIVNSPVELQIVTVNDTAKIQKIFSNRDEVIKNNPQMLERVLLAAIGLPGFLPPVLIDGEWYSDGLSFRLKGAIKAECNTIFVFVNNLLLEERERNFGTEKWYQRLIFALMMQNNFLVIKEIKRVAEYGYKLIQNSPNSVFDDVNAVGLPKKIQQRIKKLTKGLKEAVIADNLEDVFAQHRVILLTPPHPIPTLYTVGFKQPNLSTHYPGDITAAMEQGCHALDEKFWKKLN